MVIAGEPQKNDTAAQVTLIRTVPVQSDPAACDDASVEIGAKRYPLSGLAFRLAESGSMAKSVHDVGSIDLETLDAMGTARGSAWLIACETRWEVRPAVLRAIYGFVQRFRKVGNAADRDRER
jgi:hypothetical protein